MKKAFVIILTLVIVFTFAIIGCEKKQEAPKPLMQPAMTPPPPPPPAPAAPAPAPTPPPAPAKPAKK